MVTIHGGLCMYHRSQISSPTFERFVLRQRVARIGVLEKFLSVCISGMWAPKCHQTIKSASAETNSRTSHMSGKQRHSISACRIFPQAILATGMKMRQIVLQRIQ